MGYIARGDGDKVEDLRDRILSNVSGKRVVARIVADDAGVVAGTTAAREETKRLGLSLERILNEGSHIRKGDEIARFCGNPKQVLLAEEVLIGLIAKASGIATATHKVGVRIAVGQASETIIVALPGPNDEVKLSLDVVVKGLKSGLSKHMLAEDVANTLRKRLQGRHRHRVAESEHCGQG